MEYDEPDIKTERNFSGDRSEIHYKPRQSGTWVTVGDDREMPAEFVVNFWPRSEIDEPYVEIHYAVIGGVPQCRAIVISAIKRRREVRAADLRRIPIEDVLEATAAQIAEQVTTTANGTEQRVRRPLVDPWRRSGVAAVRGARRQLRRKITDDLLRQVAAVYRANVDGGKPVAAVAADLGVEDRTARLYVRRARDRGFLGEAIPGKAGER
jgi:hypothetical protein